MSLDEKLKKLELLASINTSMTKLCLDLIQNGHDDMAVKTEEILLHLSVAIEELTQKSLEEWIGISKSYVSKVEPQLSQVTDSLDEINKNIKDSKNIAKNVSKIDKALQSVLKQIT